MRYNSPGFADNAKPEVIDDWNQQIQAEFERQYTDLPVSRAFLLNDPTAIPGDPVDAVHWGADPAEPRFCLNADWARKLSDWGAKGREVFHDEYCEYTVVTKVDATGKVRLKRFSATTELAEWWTTVATHDPDGVQAMAQEVLGRPVAFRELYGDDIGDPHTVAPAVRRIKFATTVAGNGRHDDLEAAKVPTDPVGDLNRSNALFMAQPINGLDDLIYIVAFGSQPYVVDEGGAYRRANLFEIFNNYGTTYLACRNADPTAAQGAYDQVLKSVSADRAHARGSQIAFADPIGMYFRTFTTDQLTHNGGAVPASWTKWSRGRDGFYQHLEFGPGDDEDAYLDEVVLSVGAATHPIVGGYQIAQLIEVGPKVLIGAETNLNPDWVEIPVSNALDCRQAQVCTKVVKPMQQMYLHQTAPAALRIA